MPSEDPFGPIRCPRGCDPVWLQYLSWTSDDELELAATDPTRPLPQNRMATAKYEGGVGTVWKLGLRCADCGQRWGRSEVPDDVKEALDRLLTEHHYTLKAFAEELENSPDELPGLMEENGQ